MWCGGLIINGYRGKEAYRKAAFFPKGKGYSSYNDEG